MLSLSKGGHSPTQCHGIEGEDTKEEEAIRLSEAANISKAIFCNDAMFVKSINAPSNYASPNKFQYAYSFWISG